ncbi:MAG: helix-turn-helix transcriptional regulator [Phycisphaerae bacterium]|nr:helix-turn-helix transcriptional regulator [Phycisphaerae bacterium]
MKSYEIVLAAIDKGIGHGPIQDVFFAGSKTQPAVMSYVVNFPRLSMPISGFHEMEIEQNGESVVITPGAGQAIFVGPNCWNKPTWDKKCEVLTFLFGKKQTGVSLVRSNGHGLEDITATKIAIRKPLSGVGGNILQTIIDLHKKHADFGAFGQMIEVLIHCCRIEVEENLAKMNDNQKSKSYYLLEDICAYMQEHFQYDITRDYVAKQFRITPNHLSRIFKTEGNMNFSDYLTFVRIDRAKFMLSRYNMTLAEIAQRCGYLDAAYFCRVFKKVTKRTPNQYRVEFNERER